MKKIGKDCSIDLRRNRWFYVVIKFEFIKGERCEGNQSHVNVWVDKIKKLRILYNSFFGSIAKLHIFQYILYDILNYDR